MNLNEYIPLKDPNIKIHGRTSGILPLTLFWTGSAVELRADGAELYIEAQTDFNEFEQWIRIELNGFDIIRTPLERGINRICVFRGMNPETVKRVRLIKEVQPMQRDQTSFLRILSVRTDGRLYPVEDKRYKIELVGDSITSGEGLGAARGLNEWLPAVFTTRGHYAEIVSKRLNADYRIISQSGWGTYSSWDNNPFHALPKIYTKICSVLDGELPAGMGSCGDYDFSEWKPDVIVVNLGTNDAGAFNSPAWEDPADGRVYKQRKNGDGSYNGEDIRKFTDAAYSFLKLLRKCNPDAYILWAYGMIGRELLPYIEGTVQDYARENRDEKTGFALLPDLREEWMGANNHPGAPSHKAAAEALEEIISAILK